MGVIIWIQFLPVWNGKTAEMRARQGAASIREGAYIEVRNRTDTEPQRRIATHICRF